MLAALATVIGGGIPLLHKELKEKHLSLLVAFSAGVLLSTGLNHMIIESFAEAGKLAMLFVSIGFIGLYAYEKVAMVHACREHDCEVHKFGPAAMVGMGFHSFLDGFAIAVSFEFERTLGMLVIGAVILHRLPTGISTACILLANNYKEGRAWRVLAVIAGLAIAGAFTGILIPLKETFYLSAFTGILIPLKETFYLSLAVGLSGGTFLYISTSDLLPMAHKNNQDYRVPGFFLIGFLSVLATSLF